MAPWRRWPAVLAAAAALGWPGLGEGAPSPPALPPPGARVEVVQVDGIVDGPTERAVVQGLRAAEREGAEALVLQLDSEGGIDPRRAERLVRVLLGARVPVITWVGPPRARARHAAALLALAGHVRAVAPGTALGPVRTLDLRERGPVSPDRLLGLVARQRGVAGLAQRSRSRALAADEVLEADPGAVVAVQLPDVLRRVNGRTVSLGGGSRELRTDPQSLSVRFRKLDLWGRVLHGVAKPSITYLLLLLGLVGLVFEAFHPSTGPAGAAGLLALGLGLYGLHTLHGSWLGFALLGAGTAAMSVDLRVEGLGLFTAAGAGSLVAGSVLLFPAPTMRASPGVLALGVVGMLLFMLGAMTRVLRDLRAIARGELEVRDPTPHGGA